MATDETHEIQLDEFVIENDLPAFLFLVLDKLEKCFSRQATMKSHIQVIYSVCSCGSIAESNEEDRLEFQP